jgi:hypothetical protein
VSARALAVLERFPAHLAATDPEKRFETVVSGLTEALEVLTRQVADVRRSHRLSEAPTVGDVRALAGLHGLSGHLWDLLELRIDALATAAAADPLDPGRLAGLLNVTEEQLALVGTGGAHGDAPLAVVVARPAGDRTSLALRREVVRAVVRAHTVGNATATSLLTATAGYLGLEIEAVVHTEDRWWHLASCRDLVRLEPTPGAEVEPLVDLVALEENPFRPADIAPAARKHGQGFQVIRGGIDDVTVTVRVIGVGTRTVRPMVVQAHAGRGLVFEGDVDDGAELRFEASGRATLDGADVTGSTWSFTGAVFGSSARPASSHDFVFGGAPEDDDRDDTDRLARFVVTSPLADALEPTAAFPHGAPTVEPLPLPRGVSRWVGFVRVAHTSGPAGAPPRTKLGRFDAAVFAEADGPTGPSAGEPSMRLGFEWEEREPFAVRVLLPRRLQALDDEQGSTLRRPLRQRLDRHRAAGVDVRVEYADPRWTLGAGVVRDRTDDAIGTVLSGTELWTDGSPQPGNG